MGRLNPFAYRSGNFILFKIDARCKLICICFLTIAITSADFLQLGLITVTLLWLLYRCDFNIIVLLKELKYFFLLLLFVLFARGVTTSGDALSIPIFEFMKKIKFMEIRLFDIINYININLLPYIYMTKEGLIDGFKVVWRFMIIMIMGVLFSCSTSSSSLKDAVIWFLKPIPFIPEKRAGVMVSLFVRFLPLIIEKISEVSDAQKARCSHLQKNPIKKIKNLSLPLITKVFSSADTLSIGMASRCYTDNRTETADYNMLHSGYEIHFYAATIALSAITLFL
ncbi:MAG: energy-coupling factor transporter transmembrane protein EcfT [Desulfamplus sp.]